MNEKGDFGNINESIEDIYSLSPLQQGMLFHTIYDPTSDIYLEQYRISVLGELEPRVFELCWREVAARHTALRTSFCWEGLRWPVQVVYRSMPVPFDYFDWSGLSEEDYRRQIDAYLAAEREQGFDLASLPLMTLTLIRKASNLHTFIFSHHHILIDGWSVSIVLDEVLTLYDARIRGGVKTLQPSIPYRKYIDWLEQQDRAPAEVFWRSTLAGFVAPTRLPMRRTQTSEVQWRGQQGRELFWISDNTTKALQGLARQHQVTFNTLIQGAWALLLARFAGEEDVVFGATVSVRPADLEGMESMVGLFINTLPVRVRISWNMSLAEWLRKLQAQQFEMRQHDYCSLISIQGWSDVRRGLPLFESLLVFENYPTKASEYRKKQILQVVDYTTFERTNFPLNVISGVVDSRLFFRILYSEIEFERNVIICLLGHLQRLLEGMITSWSTQLMDLCLLSEAEREQLEEWNHTEMEYPRDECIHELFEEQVGRTPEAVAVVFEDEQLTYEELNKRANQLAHYLRELGVRAEVCVGICLERSLEMVVGLLGILKAGGAYVPLDPEYPVERLKYMVEDAHTPVVLTQSEMRRYFPETAAQILNLDTEWPQIMKQNGENVTCGTDLENAAYVIYTSGSTGQSKGVVNTHGGIRNRLLWMQDVYGLNVSDRVLQKTSFSFDVSVWEFFWPLLTGARLILAKQGGQRDSRYLIETICQKGITTLHFVPSMLGSFLEEPGIEVCSATLRQVMCSGEVLSANLVERFYEWSWGRLHNLYGPTEAAVDVTFWECVKEEQPFTIPIGRPIANTKIYILDRNFNPVVVGVVGELYIGGAGLARGYLNRSELTAERFVPNLFSKEGGERLYRTGDLGRWRADGNIEFVGRIDDQVKVRGYRIEPGEIEVVLREQAGVRDAVVVAREDEAGQKWLVGYVVGRESEAPRVSELRTKLKEKLPEYMVPSTFVFLEELPLTPNGKVDRKALPVPEGIRPELGQRYVAPRTPTEELLAGIWAEVLGLERVGVEDNFFELGGHSLLATQVISRIREVFQIDLPLRRLFEALTVVGLVTGIEEAQRAGKVNTQPALRRVEREKALPLSYAQERLWFLDQLVPNNAFYNVPMAMRLEGLLDVEALERALNELVQRHEALRTHFVSVEGRPKQEILAGFKLKLGVEDLRGRGEEERKEEVKRLVREEGARPFNLGEDLLLRGGLLRLGEREHVLLVTMHHIVSDGWSMGVLLRELTALYTAFREGQPSPLAALSIQYADFAVWQREWLQGEILEKQLEYWRGQLAGLAVLELPTDRVRPTMLSYKAGIATTILSEELSEQLRKLSQEEGATLFMVLLAAFQVLLSRYSGQEDVVVASPIANRNRVEIESLIGFFVNTLVMRTDVSGDPCFRELVERVREVCLGAYTNQDLPFEKLVAELDPERDLSRNPMVQVMFALQNAPGGAMDLPELKLQSMENEEVRTRLDQEWHVWEQGRQFRVTVCYSTDLFEAGTVERMVRHYQSLLEGIVANPEQRISGLEMLSEEERQQILVEWNETGQAVPQTTLPQLFEEQVGRTPEAVAVVFEDEQLTYEELNKRVNQLAHYLRELGVRAEVRVGICLERSLEMVVGLLGILKAGGAYVPLDPEYPVERLKYMVEDSAPTVLLTQSQMCGRLPETVARIVELDTEWSQIAEQSKENMSVELEAENTAYIIYTSGSTGKPKGVVNIHRGVLNLAHAQSQIFVFQNNDGVLQFASQSFDAAVWEWLMTLLSGAHLVLGLPGKLLGTDLQRLVKQRQVTTATVPPSVLATLSEEELSGLGTLVVAGDVCPIDLVRRWSRGRRMLNAYGPTETTVCATISLPLIMDSTCPIGRPIANTKIYILDRNFNPVVVGVVGELYIGGAGLARGYLNRSELTAERFVPNLFSKEGGERLYRTGDLGRWRADGNIEFVGRIDDQVKVRGYRIEPGEIEVVLREQAGVRDAVVVAREDEAGQKRLVGYVVAVPRVALGDEESRRLQSERVSQWRTLYGEIFARANKQAVSGEFASWNSSYTGEPIPEEQMRAWREQTVERILSLQPRRVLEIGCGLGLLLYPIALQCEQYWGTDFSEAALHYVQRRVHGMSQQCKVKILETREADDFAGIPEEAFDVVVLNSVCQYFPSIDYFMRVLEKAIGSVKRGGAIFLGDLRSLPLLEAYNVSVQVYKALPSVSREELGRRVSNQMSREEELVIDPGLFAVLKERFPQLGRVLIEPKRGGEDNELTKFRYDVTLRIEEMGDCVEPAWEEWRKGEYTLCKLRQRLKEERPEILGLIDVPNSRLWSEAQMLEWMRKKQGIDVVRNLREVLQEKAPVSWVRPEELWELAEALQYGMEISWRSGRPDGSFDVVFWNQKNYTDQIVWPSVVSKLQSSYGNNPLQEELMRIMVPDLRHYLEEKLPEYMVPSTFVFLEELPLTPNGKVDRKALPVPEGIRPELGQRYVAPRTPTEELLAGIWAEVLGLERVGVEDNFFELGGHSLLATQVISRIREVFQIDLPLRRLFEALTVVGLVTGIEEAQRAGKVNTQPALRRVEREKALPLSYAQERLWFLDQLVPNNAFYNVPMAMRLEGLLDVEALERALNELVQRHEALRTHFVSVEGRPKQEILAGFKLKLGVEDLRGRGEEERKEEVKRLVREEGARPFNLGEDLLLRGGLLRLGEREHVLLVTMHHIVSDGWSMGVLLRELTALYTAFREGQPSPLAALSIQYADFAVWQREWLQGEILEKQLEYWRGQLAGLAVLELPTDRVRPTMLSYKAGIATTILSEELSEQLRKLSQEEGATLFMVLLAAFQVLLSRYSGQEDVVVASPIANRNRVEIESLIGFFVNTLVMRTDVSGDPCFRELVERVREVCLGAYTNQDLPFEKLVAELDPERDLSRNPMVQVMFALQNAPGGAMDLPELKLQSMENEEVRTRLDQEWHVWEQGRQFRVTVCYSTDLFEAGTVERMVRHYQSLLEGIVANPEQRISGLEMLSEEERQQILVEWNETGQAVPQTTLPQLFEEQVGRTPEAVAVVFEDEQLTYEELNKRVNQLAHYLRELGVRAEVRVGICLERSLEMVVGLLGILKAGGAYVPLDPEYPVERLKYMVEDSAPTVLLTQSQMCGRLPETVARIVELDTEWSQIAEQSKENMSVELEAENTAYIIYTSGSTGKPKGVIALHVGVVNRLCWMWKEFPFESNEVCCQKTSLNFVDSAAEIWGGVLKGHRIIIIPDDSIRDLYRFGTILSRSLVTRVVVVPSLLRMVLDSHFELDYFIRGLKYWICSGEVLLNELLIQFESRLSNRTLINLYGSSEVSADVTCCIFQNLRQTCISIGRPIANTKIYILDRNFNPVVVGVVGELYIGGAGLARGYLNRSELTAERFVPNLFSKEGGERLYRTGDLGRWRADGNIEFVGRIDDQVKVRGYRIEPGEIEVVLREQAGVRDAVVVAREDEAGQKRLVGYVVGRESEAPRVSELRTKLKEKLPEYMVPSTFVFLEELPLTPNGKVDRKALPVPEGIRPELGQRYVAPRTPTEELLAGIWAEVLGLERVGVEDNFFELGGHSLLATQVISRIGEVFQIDLPLRSLFELLTPAALSAIIEEALLNEIERLPEEETIRLIDQQRLNG